MPIQKLNDCLTDEQEDFIKAKAKKMMYFWPRKLKKASRGDYRKKIALAYRILEHNPMVPLDQENLLERLEVSIKKLGSQKPKYVKDIFNKLMAFEKFKETEPKGDYPDDHLSDAEKPLSKKDRKWKELKNAICKTAYQTFMERYQESDDEISIPEEMKENEAPPAKKLKLNLAPTTQENEFDDLR